MLNEEQQGHVRMQLERDLTPYVRELLDGALNGNTTAATNLANNFPDSRRGCLVVAFACLRGPVEAFRALLQVVWWHHHELIIAAAGPRQSLQAIFDYACFDKSHIPDPVTLYRGTSISPDGAIPLGYSWTTNRDTACWFAMEQKIVGQKPVVLKATLPKEAVYVFPSELDESEIIVFDHSEALIDGCEDDWVIGAIRWATKGR